MAVVGYAQILQESYFSEPSFSLIVPRIKEPYDSLGSRWIEHICPKGTQETLLRQRESRTAVLKYAIQGKKRENIVTHP